MEAECEDDINEEDSKNHAPHSEQVLPLQSKRKDDQDLYFMQILTYPSDPDMVIDKPLSVPDKVSSQ